MSNQFWLSYLQQNRIFAVIRAPEMELGRKMALAVAAGGIRLIEITFNSACPEKLITQLRSELPHCTIGTGTLLNQKQLKSAISAGAQFLFTPHINDKMIAEAVNKNIPIIPGALTPTEIVTAWNYGASCVKVFPVQALGGTNYIKSLQGPLGHIPLIPTGGVTKENAKQFLQAGAQAVGLSSELFPKQLVINQDWEGISQLAQNIIQVVK